MIALHGIGSRQDLPLPFEYVLVGASITLVVTFWLAIWAWRSPRFAQLKGRPLPRLSALVASRPVQWAAKGLVAAVALLAAAALIAGVDRVDNPVFGFVFVLVWVGLVPVSLLLGGVWRATNPIRLLTRSPATEGPRTVAPAALALLGFCFFELVQPDRATLVVMRVWVALWAGWLLVGVLARGRRWIGIADPFEVYASTVAKLSPWSRTHDGVLQLTNPLRNLGSWAPPRHLAAVCVVLLGGTAYDSFSNVLWWVQLTQNSPVPREIWGTAGLLTMVAIVGACFYGAAALMRLKGSSVRAQADLMAPGLVPIVVGYALAHYGTLLWLEGQRTLIQFSDPLGRGWNLFGTAELGVDTAIINYSALIAVAQVVCIVGGHVLGVLISHDIAIRYLQDDGRRFGRQVTGQAPMLAIMVFFTVSGLLLLFA